jgi:hypothetical protein
LVSTFQVFPEFYSLNPTEPEIKFAHMWSELYPELDLHFQEPLAGYPRSKWDFAHLPTKTGIEIHGGINQGQMGHRSASGVQADMRKQRRAAEHNWAYVAIASHDTESKEKLAEIAQIIKNRFFNEYH